MDIKKYLKRIKKRAKENNKSFILMTIDMGIWYLFYGSTLTDYLNYEFYNKSFKERKSYAVVRTQNKFYETVSPTKYKTYFTVKPNFLVNFKDYIGRDYYIPEMGIDRLKKFIKNNKEFMIKPIDGLGGFGVVKLKSSDIKNIDEFYNKLVLDRCFLEELIIQNKKMNKLCSTSVNTIRIMTYANNNKSKVIFAVLRVGNGINSVDNFHSGGVAATIDYNTGKLVGDAVDKELNIYEKHPTTNTKFDGFEIPYFKEATELVCKCALVNQNIHVVGWDVAITDKGPVLVEGNRRPGFDLVQVSNRRGRKDLINSVLKEYNDENISNT